MEDIKQLMQDHYIKYASYVILDRAIPHVIDGLKPVQRRILYTLWQMHDGKLHKVANVAGQTMALHPHGDAPIVEALVNIANKGYLLDRQGNFGNLFTGDPAAAGRYIETRLTPMAKETLFNPDLTATLPSYDGRHQEPVCLPAKIPVVLLQGADGIAVGMSTHIFPHNFVELLEAEIAILEGKPFNILPDFPTGGIMDATEYDNGRGKVRLRAKIEVRDAKTLTITEICYGTTTESLIRSIDEAAKKGKIKIDAINDYTAEKVEIEIKLPRGQYAEDLLDALYAYTECQVTLHSQIVVIKDNYPWETDVDSILHLYTEKLQEYLRRELEIEQDRLKEKIFEKSLEQIFIENRLYKLIENLDSYEKVHQTITASLVPFHSQLLREPTEDDRERLLSIPIRRISRFDIKKNQEDILAYGEQLAVVEKDLKSIKKVAIRYLNGLIKKFASDYPRKTEIQAIQQVNTRAMETRQVSVGFDPATGFVGTKVVSPHVIECTNFDKLLVIFKDGTYQVINIPEKQYVHHNGNKVVYVGIADKKTVVNVVYRDPETHYVYAKRFIIEKFILEKVYRYLDEGMSLEFISTDSQVTLELQFIPKPRQTLAKTQFQIDKVAVKGVSAKGIRMANREVKKIVLVK
ncbi:DNA topoisomerase IV subunit A [Candidatus Protochlamydia naegleriophila]|uniref:DNA topoisomerase IV subunit A n=1 Tax=Candidatus Protochlamydia naegleriophila TaxID=389348 RepID=A0A0U5JCD6_9BACT|nr:DNA topoisomerase IV subunit A [Candidatus Protochlamydia naegleriophila]CUI16031.1 DNA topoisomerase IV subunit A [Candidatus Protochlamydia naegleriophila]